MYSYKDRIRAVELFIKLGKRVAETIHQLGYPTENALKSWYRAYEQGSDLPRGYARTKPKYSPAQRTLARAHRLAMLETGEAKSLKEIATQEGIDNSYVSRMVNLTTLAPDIVAFILDDAMPNHVTLFDLAVDPPTL